MFFRLADQLAKVSRRKQLVIFGRSGRLFSFCLFIFLHQNFLTLTHNTSEPYLLIHCGSRQRLWILISACCILSTARVFHQGQAQSPLASRSCIYTYPAITRQDAKQQDLILAADLTLWITTYLHPSSLFIFHLRSPIYRYNRFLDLSSSPSTPSPPIISLCPTIIIQAAIKRLFNDVLSPECRRSLISFAETLHSLVGYRTRAPSFLTVVQF